MMMRTGERWHCTNRACRCSILVETTGETDGKNPLCTCGSIMKKEYSPTVFQYLDFLRFPEPVLSRRDSQEE
jgi:hypothetical protein